MSEERRAGRARRAPARRPRTPDRRPAPLPLPPPARARRRLRGRARRLAAARPRAQRRRRWPSVGASALERAHHVERSARHGDPAAIALLREAGEAAVGRAPATAARLFGAALRLLGPARGRAARTCSRRRRRAHMGAGQWREAYDAIRESLALSDDAAGPGDRDRGRAREHARPPPGGARAPAGRAGRAAGSSARPTAVDADARDRPRRPLPHALRRRCATWVDAQRSTPPARSATAGCSPRPPPASRSRARSAGDIEAGRAAADEAAALVDAMPDEELARQLEFAGNALAAAEMLLDRYEIGLRARRAHAGRRGGHGPGSAPPRALLDRHRADDGRPPARGRRGARHRDRDRPRRRATSRG